MMRYAALAVALLFALQAPLASIADLRGGGGGRGGGGMRGGGGGARPAGGGNRGGGFDLNRDARPARPAQQPAQRPAQRPAQQPAQRPGNSGAARPNNGGNGNNVNRGNGNNVNGGNRNNVNGGNRNNVNGGNRNNVNGGNRTNVNGGNRTNVNSGNRTNVNVSGNTINRTVISNPVYVNNSAWGWNHGVAWAPAPYYYGGGFWGAMAIGVTSAAVFGAVVNAGHTYTSYQVQPSSPGATFLSNYQLTQTQCGPPNLVVVYGPSNSVICAYPNNLVSAGQYNLDTTTLSITSAG